MAVLSGGPVCVNPPGDPHGSEEAGSADPAGTAVAGQAPGSPTGPAGALSTPRRTLRRLRSADREGQRSAPACFVDYGT